MTKASKKVVILGHFGVGKSSLMRRFVRDEFTNDYKVTIGVHILKKVVPVDENEITLVLWDIEGIDDFNKYRPSYLLGASCFIYVFDAARIATYQNINYNKEYLAEKFPKVKTHIIANKMDIVDKDELMNNLSDLNIDVKFFASAKTGDNVKELFQTIATELITDDQRN